MPLGHNESVDGITGTISGLRVEEKQKYVPPHLRNQVRAPEPTNWADQAEDVDPRDRDQRGGGGSGGWDRSGSWGMERPRGGGAAGAGGGDRWGGGGGGDRDRDRGDRRDFGGRDSGRDTRGPPPSFNNRGGGGGGGRGGSFGGLDRWTNWQDSRHDPAARAEEARLAKPVLDPAALAVFGDHTNSGLNFEAYDDIPVETSGKDCPTALVAFDDVDLGDIITNNILLAKYTKPTPVQKTSIPIVLKGMFSV
jgi:ATP-dependent RNA helicase DDX3X